MTMKYAFILILTLTFYSCSTGKLKFDRIEYYSGNNSLPPNYREMLEIKIDSSQIKITKRKGEDVDNNEVVISSKDFLNLQLKAKKLPRKTPKQQFADGAAVIGISFYKADSLIHSTYWQPQQKISKKTSALQLAILELLPSTPTAPIIEKGKSEYGQ